MSLEIVSFASENAQWQDQILKKAICDIINAHGSAVMDAIELFSHLDWLTGAVNPLPGLKLKVKFCPLVLDGKGKSRIK